MTAQNGEGVYGDGAGVVTPLAHKLSQNGPLVKDSTGKPRSGVFYAGNASLVTGKANMSYDVAPFEAAICRTRTKGTSYPTNDSVVNVTTTAAPGSNSRIDIIYFQQKEVSEGDASTAAVVGVVQGTAASSPSAPTLPDGAIELARAVVGAGITATTSAVITQTAPFTAASGGTVVVRNATERDGGTPYVAASWLTGQRVLQLDTGVEYWHDGAALRPAVGIVPVVPSSAAGGTVSDKGTVTFTAATAVNLNGVFTSGFDNYRIEVDITGRSATVDIAMKLRSSGTDNSANAYAGVKSHAVGTGQVVSTPTTSTGGWAIDAGGQPRSVVVIELHSPALAVATLGWSDFVSGTTYSGRYNLNHSAASAFDGFSLTPTSGTITGTVRVKAWT